VRRRSLLLLALLAFALAGLALAVLIWSFVQ
jgi:hypothetical protein